MDYAKESLRLHGDWKGKIEVVTRVPVENKDDLSLAYTPGVAQPCLEIQKDINKSYELTRRWNMCLVVTDGSAVLGLGDIGPEAGMPVMEGKCMGKMLPQSLSVLKKCWSISMRILPVRLRWKILLPAPA